MHADSSRKRARRAPNGATTAERFWPWVEKDSPGGCWLWTGACQWTGHGIASRPKGEPGSRLAHRIAWELCCGPIPEGKQINHHTFCENQNCVNPDHLYVGDPAANMRDIWSRGRKRGQRAGRKPEPMPDPVVCRCYHCGNFFLNAPANVARGNARFCRRPCYNAFKSASIEVRFWRGIHKTESCWLWTKARSHGYGVLPLSGHGAGIVRAHVFSYEMHFGPVPEGLQVNHVCPGGGNRACCNPAHLLAGTQKENMAHKIADGRQPRGDDAPARKYPERMPRGETHKNSKLTDEAVREIRRLAQQIPAPSNGEIARCFGVGTSQVWSVLHGHTWKHVK